jgi:hypothetical protein
MTSRGLFERQSLGPHREVLDRFDHPAAGAGAGDRRVFKPEGRLALARLVGVHIDLEVGIVAHAHHVPGELEGLRVARLAHERPRTPTNACQLYRHIWQYTVHVVTLTPQKTSRHPIITWSHARTRMCELAAASMYFIGASNVLMS